MGKMLVVWGVGAQTVFYESEQQKIHRGGRRDDEKPQSSQRTQRRDGEKNGLVVGVAVVVSAFLVIIS